MALHSFKERSMVLEDLRSHGVMRSNHSCRTTGSNKGRVRACIFVHEQKELSVAVHGDDFAVSGCMEASALVDNDIGESVGVDSARFHGTESTCKCRSARITIIGRNMRRQ